MNVTLHVKPVATMNTTEAQDYVADLTIWKELTERWGLHPLKGGKGQKNTRWLVADIDRALALMSSQWKA